MTRKPTTTTPELEALRKGQPKRQRLDPSYILDKAIYQLWETINDLDQIQPEQVQHYRVSVFGSSRIRHGDPIYDEVKMLSFELAKMGVDIVTGGGPGLMEAANAGAIEGQVDSKSRSFGLAIHLPSEEGANPFVDKSSATARSSAVCITSSGSRRRLSSCPAGSGRPSSFSWSGSSCRSST